MKPTDCTGAPKKIQEEDWFIENRIVLNAVESDDKLVQPFDAAILLTNFYINTRIETLKNVRFFVKKVMGYSASPYGEVKKIWAFKISFDFHDHYLGANFQVQKCGASEIKLRAKKIAAYRYIRQKHRVGFSPWLMSI